MPLRSSFPAVNGGLVLVLVTALVAAAHATAAADSIVADCPANASGLPLNVLTPTITAGAPALVTIPGLRQGQAVELQGYSQNHYGTVTFDSDPTPVDRRVIADENGAATVSDLRLTSNTRLRARLAGCPSWRSGDVGQVVNVRAAHTLSIARIRAMTFRFSGRSVPERQDGLLVGIYRVTGTPCAAGTSGAACSTEHLVALVRAPADGRWSVSLTLPRATAGRTVSYVSKTGQDAQNAPGRSGVSTFRVT